MTVFLYSLTVIYIICILLTTDVSAALKINEIYPAPESGEYEWVEVYNDENKTIDITGDYITDDTSISSHKLKFDVNEIPALGFLIATTSGSVLNNNDGDSAILRNASGDVIESIAYSGSFNSEKSYFRCGDGWFISTVITKNAANDSACLALTPTPTSTPTPTITPTSQPTATPKPTATPTVTAKALATAVPTKKPTPTAKPTLSTVATPSATVKHLNATTTPAVLGTKTEKTNPLSLSKIFAAIAFTFSLLTIAAVFLKMKVRHEKSN